MNEEPNEKTYLIVVNLGDKMIVELDNVFEVEDHLDLLSPNKFGIDEVRVFRVVEEIDLVEEIKIAIA